MYEYETLQSIDLTCIYVGFLLLININFTNANTRQCSLIKSKVNCSSRDLNKVPQVFPQNIEVFDLSVNRIRVLYNESFWKYTKLEILNLSHNFIYSIDQYTFTYLSKLIVLDLNTNVLFEIPPFLPPCLNKLYLDDNPKMKILDTQYDCVTDFQRLTSLEKLSLRSNKLKYFPKFCDSVPSLLDLDLSENLFVTLSRLDLAPLCRLKRLNLSFQKFKPEQFCECLAFQQWAQEHNINLSGLICETKDSPEIKCPAQLTDSAVDIYESCIKNNKIQKFLNFLLISGGVILFLGIFLSLYVLCHQKKKKSIERSEPIETRKEMVTYKKK